MLGLGELSVPVTHLGVSAPLRTERKLQKGVLSLLSFILSLLSFILPMNLLHRKAALPTAGAGKGDKEAGRRQGVFQSYFQLA